MRFVNEAAFTTTTINLFTMARWRVHHDRMKQNVEGHAGFPDIVAVRRGLVVFAELKMPGKVLEPEQVLWSIELNPTLERQGVRSFVWYPEDWDRIVEIATGRKR